MKTSSSYIVLIFASQLNLVAESFIHFLVHASCYHQITYTKTNLSFVYPPLHERKFWHQRIMAFREQQKASIGFPNVNKRVLLFSETILNIFHNLIPHETINCGNTDPPLITKTENNSSMRKIRYINTLRSLSAVELATM